VGTRPARHESPRRPRHGESGSAKTTILIADNHDAVREGIKSALRDSAEFVVIGETAVAPRTPALVRETAPAIVVLDVARADRDGIDMAERIARSAGSRTLVVIYTMHTEPAFQAEMMRVGAAGYVRKDEPLSRLIATLRKVRAGGRRFPPSGSAAADHPALSRREREIFLLLADGRTVKEAAFDLGLSPKTVETYKYRLMHKLHAANVVDLARIAIRDHLVEP